MLKKSFLLFLNSNELRNLTGSLLYPVAIEEKGSFPKTLKHLLLRNCLQWEWCPLVVNNSTTVYGSSVEVRDF